MNQTRAPSLFDGRLLVTDGGLETTLIFQDGLDLPHFAAFPLLDSEARPRALRRYYDAYGAAAATAVPVPLSTPRPFASVPIGRQGRLRGRGTTQGDRRCGLPAASSSRHLGTARRPRRHQRRDRTSRRRIFGRRDHGWHNGGSFPFPAGSGVRGGRSRCSDGPDHDSRRRGGGIAAPPLAPGFPAFVSFTVETDGGCRTALCCVTPSSRSTPPLAGPRCFTWSIALIRPTSRLRSKPAATRYCRWAACVPIPRRRAVRN